MVTTNLKLKFNREIVSHNLVTWLYILQLTIFEYAYIIKLTSNQMKNM